MRKFINKDVKFFMMNGLVSLPLMVVMLAPSWPLFGFLLIFSFILFLLQSRGMDLHMLSRRIRSFFAGRRRDIRSRHRKFM